MATKLRRAQNLPLMLPRALAMKASMSQPTVGQYVGPHVHCIPPTESLRTARDLMQAHGIRHLPVVRGGQLVGLLSLSDLYVLESSLGVDPEASRVADAVQGEVYAVGPEAPLGEVARAMTEKRIGAAVVVEHEKVIGLFTATDAVRALADTLEGRP